MDYCGRNDNDTHWNDCEQNHGSKSLCYFRSIACDRPALPRLAPTEVSRERHHI